MRAAALALTAVLALTGCHGGNPAAKSETARSLETVQLKAADGVTVFGTYVTPPEPRALILLFHQAESGQGEYTAIAPRLADKGYASLAIDQRAGGDMFGGNWTVKQLGRAAGYLDARQDLEAALAWAKQKKLPVILWGSSYSASLVFLIAAERPGEVKALLAFSPDEYFDGKPSVKAAAAKVQVPVFVTSAQSEEEIAAAKAIIDAAASPVKDRFVPRRGGVHGSSTLLRNRNAEGAEAAWKAVFAFLDYVAPAK